MAVSNRYERLDIRKTRLLGLNQISQGTHPYQYSSLVLLPAFRHQSQFTLPPGLTGEWILQNNPTHQVHLSTIPFLHFSHSLPQSWHPIVSFYS
jgi:hypothetical protein